MLLRSRPARDRQTAVNIASRSSRSKLCFDIAAGQTYYVTSCKRIGPYTAKGVVQLSPTDYPENQNNAAGKTGYGDHFPTPSANLPSRLTVDQVLDLAFSHYDSGGLQEAEQLCRRVLEKAPRQVDALQLLGAVLNQRGQYAEAVQLLADAISQAPERAHLHNNLGIALNRLERFEEAVSEFTRAIQIQPDSAKAHNNLGVALMELGRMDEATTACKEAIRLADDFKEAHNNLALVLKKKGDMEGAVASYERAVTLDPEYAEALSNLGMALMAQDRLKEATGNLLKAASLAPNSAEFQNNLGVLHNRQGHLQEAVAASEKAIAIRPHYVEAHNNLGTALMELGRFSEANAAFEKAIALDPECAQAHHNRSLVLLLTAQFEQGWAEYEWRWRHEGFSTPLRPFPQQRWDGSAENVKGLLVWAEQGIGDEVQFSGLIQHITSQGIDVVVECDPRLVSLLQRSFPGSIFLGRTNPPAPLPKDPPITHQIPMASLPRVLALSPDSMPFQNPFMTPDKEKRDRFRSQYKSDGAHLLVGISYRSGNRQEGPKRSIDLDSWGPVLKTAGATFVNLQYGECSAELQAARDRFGVQVIEDKTVDSLTGLDTFAAQVAAMDLVISVDNSTVHFAGALGVKVWTMLPTVPDWRWGLEGDTTRWYPTMRLFRQQQPRAWEPVISKVAQELTAFINPH
ncbi:MAG: tetratricopeptide repeat protein [Planctomycetota bacterium]